MRALYITKSVPNLSGSRMALTILLAMSAALISGCHCLKCHNNALTQQPMTISLKDNTMNPNWTYDHGGIVRGDRTKKEMALIFTGGDFGEGAMHILDELAARGIKAGFFVTGDYVRKPGYDAHLKRMVAEGHYLGPHSDTHPLYAPWEDRSKTLVTREFFREDLQKNIDDLRALGAMSNPDQPVYFIPPYEWFNDDQTEWSREMGALLFNFTPGSGSNRDWAPEDHKSFAPSEKIMSDILAFEAREKDGLNGFLLLLHLGSQREDKMHRLLGPLLDELIKLGYAFKRVDELIPVVK